MSDVSCIIMETWPLSGASAVIPCLHLGHIPMFNLSAAQYQTPEWVAQRYPRYHSVCVSCKQETIIYASMEHAIAGGWY